MIIRPYGSEKFDKPWFETFYGAIKVDATRLFLLAQWFLHPFPASRLCRQPESKAVISFLIFLVFDFTGQLGYYAILHNTPWGVLRLAKDNALGPQKAV